MGPEGGDGGGTVVAHGTPEQIATVAGSYTGQFLAQHFNLREDAQPVTYSLAHAGAQPAQFAAPDKDKRLKPKFEAPQKKTGRPSAKAGGNSAAKPERKPIAAKSERPAGGKAATETQQSPVKRRRTR
jgi:excinuclease ABC subunit A